MGPMGQGPQTGRGLGFCSGNATPGAATAGGRGFGGGRGRGQGGGGGGGKGRGRRGNRNMFYATGLTGWQRDAVSGTALAAGTDIPASTPTPPTDAADASGTALAADPASPPTPTPVQQTDVAELFNVLQQIQARLAALEEKSAEPVTTETPNA